MTRGRNKGPHLLADARRRAKKRRLAFTITVDDIADLLKAANGVCELTGPPFNLSKNDGYFRRPFAPSLDRIDSSKGYTPGNVRVVLYAANAAMNEWGFDVLLQMARGIVRKHG